MLQNRNRIVNELLNAESIFAASAAVSGEAKIMNDLANNMKRGAPGGCPTSSLYADAINSPQSQKLDVGSTVSRYTTVAISHTDHPVQMLRRLKLIKSSSSASQRYELTPALPLNYNSFSRSCKSYNLHCVHPASKLVNVKL